MTPTEYRLIGYDKVEGKEVVFFRHKDEETVMAIQKMIWKETGIHTIIANVY